MAHKANKNHIDFLLEYAFDLEKGDKYYKEAFTLITEGSVVIAGDENVFKSKRIREFLVISTKSNVFGSLHYELDINYFLSSNAYKGMKTLAIDGINRSVFDLLEKKQDIASLNPYTVFQ